jgi:cytidyltransferase-like protein
MTDLPNLSENSSFEDESDKLSDSDLVADEVAEILVIEAPPDIPPPAGFVVLGRFQPFHHGHAHLIAAAAEFANAASMPLRIAIGSTNRSESMSNPWNYEERCSMIEAWAEEEGISLEVVGVPDIEDPPRWVEHASQYHGEAGTLVTSDEAINSLYEAAGWSIELVSLTSRDDLQGWRIRATMQMMSTISDHVAVQTVLQPTIPAVIIDWLLEANALRRLAFLGCGGEPVG